MAISLIKATRIVNAGLGVLVRELTLPNLVWRDAAGDFAGALNDTISIRVPAFVTANSRNLRSGSARSRDDLNDRKVDVTLTTDVYKDMVITDEALSLDIADFGEQVLNPVMAGVALKLEDTLGSTITGATYQNSLSFTYSTGEPYKDIAVAARRKLNDARVPMSGRVLVVGSGVEAALLTSDKFIRADYMGGYNADGSSAMRDANIGRVAGFDVYASPALAPDTAYAFHKTAFVMSNRAPLVPAGAPFGASASYEGFALRVVRVLDPTAITDILATDSWVGSNVVTDDGWYDVNGIFQPAQLALGAAQTFTATASTDLATLNSHGYSNGDVVTVVSIASGAAGLAVGRGYYVVGATTNTIQFSNTSGGTAIDITSDGTGLVLRKGGAPLLTRAVKVTAS